MAPTATLIIPTFQRQHLLAGLLDQLSAQSNSNFEVLIVDQTPEPAQAIIESIKDQPSIRYLHCSHASLPNARNIGAKHAQGEVLIYIDDDVTMDKGFIEGHLKALEDSALSATAGRITGGYDSDAGNAGEPNANQVGRFSKLTATVSRNFHGTRRVHDIDQLPGGNFAIRREAFLKIGGFDLVAFGGRAAIGEETDFACRLRDAKGRIDFVPDAALHHDHADEGGCREAIRKDWTYWHAHNFTTLMQRFLPLWAWPVFSVVFGLRYLVHGLKAFNPMVTLAGWRGMLAPFLHVNHPPTELQTIGEVKELG